MTGEVWGERNLLIFGIFVRRPTEKLYGWALMRETSLPSDTVYTVLRRLKERGLISSKRERIDHRVTSRPARTFYQITPEGLKAAENLRMMLTA